MVSDLPSDVGASMLVQEGGKEWMGPSVEMGDPTTDTGIWDSVLSL